MKFLVLTLTALAASSTATAYTWSGNDFTSSSVGGGYSSGGWSHFSGSDSGTSNGHSYLNYGRIGGSSGGRVSIPTGGSISSYNDPGNDREVIIPVRNPNPPQGNFGKAINRGVGYKRYY